MIIGTSEDGIVRQCEQCNAVYKGNHCPHCALAAMNRNKRPKKAKKKRCNPVKAATLLSVIFSCVRTAYLSEFSISATSFAVAVTILNPLSLILSSRVSSCHRCVDFSASLFWEKNWSTDML